MLMCFSSADLRSQCPKMGHNSNLGNCLLRLVQSDGFRASSSGRLNIGGRKRIPDEREGQKYKVVFSPAGAVLR